MDLNDSLYDEKLAWFKTNERPEAVLVVADDTELTRLVAAWPTVAVERKAGDGEPPTHTEYEWW